MFAEPSLHFAPTSQIFHFNAPVSAAVPLNSYRAPQAPEVENGGPGPSQRIARNSHSKGANGHNDGDEKSHMLSSFSMQITDAKDANKEE